MMGDEEESRELQEAEFEALQSSFEAEDLEIDRDASGSCRGIFTAFMSLPADEPFKVVGPAGQGDDAAAVGTQTLTLKFLPPLTLRFAMPAGYPVSSPPEYDLRAGWLPAASLRRLRDELKRICQENEGGFVLFAMFQFLQQEASGCLGIADNTINVLLASELPRVRAGLFRFFLESGRDQSDRAFRRQTHECVLCASEKPGEGFVRFKDCNHFFCIECTRRGFALHVRSGEVDLVKCFECGAVLPQHQLRQLLDDDLFERYEHLTLSRSLDLMSDVTECPRDVCRTPVVLDIDESLGVCSACGFAFCMHCKKTFHGVNPCNIKDSVGIINAYTSSSASEKERMDKMYGKRNIEKMIENHNSEQYIDKSSKRCPSCHSPIEKSDGCNKMMCGKCGAFFCWLCQLPITSKNPYSHFSSGPCANRLFEGITFEEWEFDF